ncbi:phage major capsid protein [Novosphingobium sp. SG707]|uniref:phage major capsid protein n=1 Tax=Novosphingobium sp. SG707 TaxID=2586996 RepID=UPI0014457DF3|nr:phage major capsid protein [Novosphingobium sp. SG707]NKI99595.1 HK97 family phage major capsid protein [Novosphingobium sp. SG707]
MNALTPIRFRGAARVRAETPTPAATLDAINRAVTEMRAKYDEELAAVRAGQSDIVRTEEVNRINASITELTNTLNAQQEAIAAAAALGGNGRNALSAEARQHAETFNRWFRRGDQSAEAALGDLQVRAGLTTQSDPDGGWLVPEEMDRTITRVLSVVSAMRGLSRVITTASGEYSALVSQGGAGAGWVGEEEARPKTGTPTLSKIELPTGEIYASPAATQRVLDDGYLDVAQWVADEVSITFAEAEGAAFISGNGINKPRGFLSYTAIDNASYAWGKIGFKVTGAAAAFAATSPTDALMDLYYSLKAGYRNGASFITSDAVLGTIRKFKDGQGNYIWAPPTSDMPGTILGKPVYTDDNMPALGANAFPVAFGNFARAYTIVDRMGTRILRDPFTNKPNVLFYTTKRVGGGVTNFEAIKLLKCST